MGGRGASSGAGKYEKAVSYKATRFYSAQVVEDPQGIYMGVSGYSLKETYAENSAFKELRKLPVGSRVIVHVPKYEYTWGAGVVPAHDEYYEVIQRTKTIKALQPIRSTDKREIFTVGRNIYYGGHFLLGIGSIKETQENLRCSDRITIQRKR